MSSDPFFASPAPVNILKSSPSLHLLPVHASCSNSSGKWNLFLPCPSTRLVLRAPWPTELAEGTVPVLSLAFRRPGILGWAGVQQTGEDRYLPTML